MNLQESIRRILREESLSDYLELNKKNLTKVIKNLRRTYRCSTENINKGFCDDFAVKVANHFFDADTVETLFFRQLNGLSLVTYGDFSNYDDEFEPHTWIMYNGRHYDAETPNGVVSHLNLPIYKRQFENTKRINETYSSNIEQIKEFLSELEFPIILYRGLLLEKGEKINKKKLGTHWSLDEFFVRNLFYYNTFGGNRGQVSDDYNFYVITAEFNKNDIDFEGTIQKRLIKDDGHFWDELTGELIQNPKMEFHPYSHEEEILVKSTSNPKIINIEKIDIYNNMNLQESKKRILREETEYITKKILNFLKRRFEVKKIPVRDEKTSRIIKTLFFEKNGRTWVIEKGIKEIYQIAIIVDVLITFEIIDPFNVYKKDFDHNEQKIIDAIKIFLNKVM